MQPSQLKHNIYWVVFFLRTLQSMIFDIPQAFDCRCEGRMQGEFSSLTTMTLPSLLPLLLQEFFFKSAALTKVTLCAAQSALPFTRLPATCCAPPSSPAVRSAPCFSPFDKRKWSHRHLIAMPLLLFHQ